MIPQEKAALRRELSVRRDSLENREQLDQAIRERVWALSAYENAEKLLLYLSKGSEPDTWKIFDRALAQGKEVYAPRCLDGQGTMAFYQVKSREELIPGRFGLLEPSPEGRFPLGDPEGALCLVPGLAFDEEGYRLGYGKGYYDRFLAEHPVMAVGLCYKELLLPQLPRGPYDRQVNCLVTEAGALDFQKEQSPGKEDCV